MDASGDRFYYIKDHLGSTRAVIKDDGTVVEAHDYYPFGLLMPGRDYQTAERTKELFTGKERDVETGWYYHGARFRNPALGPWLSVDPLWHKYPSVSPYSYAANNPVNYIDPDGMQYRAESYVFREHWKNLQQPMHPEFRAWVNRVGPPFLNVAAGLTFWQLRVLSGALTGLSVVWTATAGTNVDLGVAFGTGLGALILGSRIPWTTYLFVAAQFGYDITLSGKYSINIEESQRDSRTTDGNEGTAEPDNTRVSTASPAMIDTRYFLYQKGFLEKRHVFENQQSQSTQKNDDEQQDNEEKQKKEKEMEEIMN